MFIQTASILLAITGARATAFLAQLAPSSELVQRDVTQGWSLQSGSAPTDAHSCGNGAYCPISLYCNALVNNDQVAACCSSCKNRLSFFITYELTYYSERLPRRSRECTHLCRPIMELMGWL